MAKRGKFITFEGLDGCGKTTQLNRLAESLRAQGIEVVTTREPGGTGIGEKIRAVLLDSRTQGLGAHAELALMFASRAQQIEEVILPNLKAGRWVLCDRFTDSSEAYQGAGRGLGVEAVHELHHALCQGLQPELTILMLSEAKASVERARKRNARVRKVDEGRFEKESAAFFQRVRAQYVKIAEREPERVVSVDAKRSIGAVHKEIMAAVRERLLD
jgi:dTMP kinase